MTTEPDPSSPPNGAEIAAKCQEAGFPLSSIRTRGDVLILVPHSLDDLPDAETLQRLGDELEAKGFRHVAFAVDS